MNCLLMGGLLHLQRSVDWLGVRSLGPFSLYQMCIKANETPEALRLCEV